MAAHDRDRLERYDDPRPAAGARSQAACAPHGSRRDVALLALCGLFIVFLSALHALEPRKQIGQYGHDSWTSQRGLPGEAVYQILQSKDGYLWLRTGAGLSRFDGIRFVPMDTEIGTETVKAIAMSADGDLLIRTSTRTVVYQNGKFADYLPPAPLPDGGIRVLFESREHIPLLGSDDFIYRLDAAGPAMLRRGTAWVNSILEDHAGKIWIGSDKALFLYQNGKLSDPLDASRYGSGVKLGVTSLFEDREQRIWAGTPTGLYPLASILASAGKPPQPTVRGRITAAIEDRQGNIWAGTEDLGVVRLTNGQASSLDSVGGLTDSSVLSLFEDREGSIWIGTASGLDRLRDTKLTTFGVSEGLPANYVKATLAARDGSLYVLTQVGGLSRIVNDKVSRLAINAELPGIYSDAMLEGSDGSLWIGTDAGLTRFKDGKLTAYPGLMSAEDERAAGTVEKAASITGHFAHHHISAIAEDKESLIVTTAELATFRFKDGRTYPFTLRGQTTPFTTPGLYTFTLHAAPTGVLWFGTSKGLYKLVPGAPEQSGLQPQVPFAVTSIYDDQQGNLWLGGRISGLVRMHIADGHVTHYTAEQGVLDSNLSHMLPDSDGNFWISTQNGIYSVSRQELEDVASGHAASASAKVYSLADGLKTTQAADTTSQPSAARTADGRLWFATYKGVVAIDPRHLMFNKLVPPVILERVVTDGWVRPIDSGSQNSLIVPPGMKAVEFHYTALSLSVPERVRFRYQLEGYDHGWVEAGSRRVAYYTNLPPGSYRFRVIAANDDGLWNEQGASAAITLKPFFYQTVLFYVLCALWVVLAGVALNRANTRRIRARAEELARLVEERTAELQHSQRELRLLAHFDSLTALPNRRMFTEDFANMRAMMKEAQFSLLLIDFDKFKQINDTHGHDAGDAFLIEASKRLKASVRSSDRVARLGGDEFAILLTGDHDEASIQQVCGRIIESFGRAVNFRGTNIATSASIGIAVFPMDGGSQEELYKAADLALYEAKRKGRNNSHRYGPALGLAQANPAEPPRSLSDSVTAQEPAFPHPGHVLVPPGI